jgi:hypothetical protein
MLLKQNNLYHQPINVPTAGLFMDKNTEGERAIGRVQCGLVYANDYFKQRLKTPSKEWRIPRS